LRHNLCDIFLALATLLLERLLHLVSLFRGLLGVLGCNLFDRCGRYKVFALACLVPSQLFLASLAQ